MLKMYVYEGLDWITLADNEDIVRVIKRMKGEIIHKRSQVCMEQLQKELSSNSFLSNCSGDAMPGGSFHPLLRLQKFTKTLIQEINRALAVRRVDKKFMTPGLLRFSPGNF